MIEPARAKCAFTHYGTKPLLVILSGPSGVGKDAVLKKMKEGESSFHYAVTATTRPAREGERDGVDYHFLSREKFQQLLERKQFLEWACVYDNYYGVPRDEITGALKRGTDVMVKVDIQGAESIKKIMPRAISIFLMPPSLEELAQRIKQRHSETPARLALRLQKAEEEIKKAIAAGDSVGGVVGIRACNCPLGLGDPVFGKLDALIAHAMMSIGAVKGVEIGDGFTVAKMYGSEQNDQMGEGGFLSNHAGGILGGISNGCDIVVRIAVKPTPSISSPQKTLDIEGRETEILIQGRHDPCIVPRIAPVAESMLALVLMDSLLEQEKYAGFSASV